MNETKIFTTDLRGYVFVGDSRDLAVAYSYRQQVYEWCSANRITVEYQGTFAGTDLWRVRNEQDRVMFTLRWL